MMKPDPRDQGLLIEAPPDGKERARQVLGLEDFILAQAWKPLHRVRIMRDVDLSSKEAARANPPKGKSHSPSTKVPRSLTPAIPSSILEASSSRITPAPMHHPLVLDDEDDLLANVALSPEELAQEARLILAAQLYERGQLSSGQAAQFCGQGRVDFLCSLARLGRPMSNLRPDEADLEIDFARHG
jgi:predicted HTH domain antitoxin